MSMGRNPAQGQTALITGASSGIGYELSKLFARDGFNLVLVARSSGALDRVAEKLRSAFKVSVRTLAKDLSNPRVPAELYADLTRDGITVDVLVNNAGYGVYGKFIETDLGEELGMLQVNMVSLTHLTKLFLPEMVARGQGGVLNVASTAAFQPGPLMAVYYATKAYVLSFTEALANEVKGTGVRVTVLCPGPTRSDFQARAQMEQSRLIHHRKLMDAGTAAEIGYAGFMKGRPLVIPGTVNKLLAQS
jgi:short-subunit dehydrogenase